MKKVFFQITSVAMAVLLLLSTISWTVDRHLCMGRVMDVSLFDKAKDCGMGLAMEVSEESHNPCCDDESFTQVGQDDLKLTWDTIEIGQQIFLQVGSQSYLEIPAEIKYRPVPLEYYPPPLLIKNLHVLHEVFLI